MGPIADYPHEAKPRPPTIHSKNPATAGRHVDSADEADESLYPLAGLCQSCGQALTRPTPGSVWMHREADQAGTDEGRLGDGQLAGADHALVPETPLG
jgi:hypothetical protein